MLPAEAVRLVTLSLPFRPLLTGAYGARFLVHHAQRVHDDDSGRGGGGRTELPLHVIAHIFDDESQRAELVAGLRAHITADDLPRARRLLELLLDPRVRPYTDRLVPGWELYYIVEDWLNAHSLAAATAAAAAAVAASAAGTGGGTHSSGSAPPTMFYYRPTPDLRRTHLCQHAVGATSGGAEPDCAIHNCKLLRLVRGESDCEFTARLLSALHRKQHVHIPVRSRQAHAHTRRNGAVVSLTYGVLVGSATIVGTVLRAAAGCQRRRL